MKWSRSSATPQQRPAARASPRRIIAFDRLHFGAIDLPRLLVAQELFDVRFELGGPLGRNVEVAIELGDEIGKANRVIIEHGDVARRLIRDVHFVPLIDQPNERAAHRDHVVVRMGRENEHPLRENVVARPRAVARLLGMRRLAARPAGDRRLQMAKHLDVDVVRRPAIGQQILQRLFVVVLVGELQDRLFELAGQPDHGLAHQCFVPFDGPQQPRRFAPRQLVGGRLVEHDVRIADAPAKSWPRSTS